MCEKCLRYVQRLSGVQTVSRCISINNVWPVSSFLYIILCNNLIRHMKTVYNEWARMNMGKWCSREWCDFRVCRYCSLWYQIVALKFVSSNRFCIIFQLTILIYFIPEIGRSLTAFSVPLCLISASAYMLFFFVSLSHFCANCTPIQSSM